MTLRQKLLLMLSLTVLAVVAVLAWTVSIRVRHVFEGLDRDQTAALVGQFQRAFDQDAKHTAAAVDIVAASEDMRNLSANLAHGDAAGHYFTVAGPIARDSRLDFLEIAGPDGTILSSAQWPARFGEKEAAIAAAGQPAFLRQEELPYGVSDLGIFAVRAVPGASPALYVVGGTRIDPAFLKNFAAPAGTTISLYRNLSADYDPRNFIAGSQDVAGGDRYAPLINQARASGQNATGVVALSPHQVDSQDVTAVPLRSGDRSVLAVLVVANSRRAMVEVQHQIRNAACVVAGCGIVFGIAASLWMAARISRPIQELARAMGEVAAGRWETRINLAARDEVGVLARTFNQMTSQLSDRRARLVQSERVAAWRGLARRLTEDLNQPLVALQVTVDKMLRAQKLPAAQSNRLYAETAATLQAEAGNLRAILESFSELSQTPHQQFRAVDARAAVRRVVKLYEPALEKRQIEVATSICAEPLPISADPELLHRALSGLVLNAMEAMPEGGSLKVAANRRGETVRISIADSGKTLEPGVAERLFSPDSSSGRQGAGPGLAMVQAVVTDHAGTVAVENAEGGGARLVIELPLIENGKNGTASPKT